MNTVPGSRPASGPGSRPRGVVRERLLEAGTDLARQGGPEAVVLREATRKVGVAPNAAYRHFADRDALVNAVASVALRRLADAMEEGIASLPDIDPGRRAAFSLAEVGKAYVDFAMAEPGLFRVAFAAHGVVDLNGHSPLDVLGATLDHCLAAGILSPEKRLGAETFCWSVVHGFAELNVSGPLSELDAEAREAELARVLERIGQALFGDIGGPSSGATHNQR